VGFEGGTITSGDGGPLLREVEKRTGIVRGFAALVAQRVYELALGYEDLNDHDELRQDPLLAVLVEKEDPKGERWV